MVLQAYIDESYEGGGLFVLGGYVSTTEAWEEFSREWEELLPRFGIFDEIGYHFKMSEMARLNKRLTKVPAFYRVIEKHTATALLCQIDMADFEAARNRISVPNMKLNFDGFFRSPYKLALKMLIDTFEGNRKRMSKIIPPLERIDFYFDQHSEKKAFRDSWNEYMANRPEKKKKYGIEPRFEDDRMFLPLQAADFIAWWVRKWHVDGNLECLGRGDFYTFRHESRPYRHISMWAPEDKLVEIFVTEIRNIAPNQIILVDGIQA